MQFSSEEIRNLTLRMFAQQLLLRAIFENFPDIADAAHRHVDAWEGRALYEGNVDGALADEVIDKARIMISGTRRTPR